MIGLVSKKKKEEEPEVSPGDKGTLREALGLSDKDKIKSVKLKVKMK